MIDSLGKHYVLSKLQIVKTVLADVDFNLKSII